MKRTVRIRVRRVRVTGPVTPGGPDRLDLEAGLLRELFPAQGGRIVRRVDQTPAPEPGKKP